MISKDFKIDFIEKRIYYNPKGSNKIYTLEDFYSFLQDTFDELDIMDDDIPIKARLGTGRYPTRSKTEYLLINGWKVDEEARKHLVLQGLTLRG